MSYRALTYDRLKKWSLHLINLLNPSVKDLQTIYTSKPINCIVISFLKSFKEKKLLTIWRKSLFVSNDSF